MWNGEERSSVGLKRGHEKGTLGKETVLWAQGEVTQEHDGHLWAALRNFLCWATSL